MWGYRISFKKGGRMPPFFTFSPLRGAAGSCSSPGNGDRAGSAVFYGDFCHIQFLGDFLVGPAFFHPLDHQFFPGTEDFFLQRMAFCRGEGIRTGPPAGNRRIPAIGRLSPAWDPAGTGAPQRAGTVCLPRLLLGWIGDGRPLLRQGPPVPLPGGPGARLFP